MENLVLSFGARQRFKKAPQRCCSKKQQQRAFRNSKWRRIFDRFFFKKGKIFSFVNNYCYYVRINSSFFLQDELLNFYYQYFFAWGNRFFFSIRIHRPWVSTNFFFTIPLYIKIVTKYQFRKLSRLRLKLFLSHQQQ